MLGAMKPGGPYPLLAIVGPQGSSKSTTAKQVKRIVDPTGPGGIAVYTAPRDRSAEDVFSLARGSHLLVWDNVSTLGDALSDVLSALATGAAAGARKKYSDFDPAETYACRPLALTSIPDAVRRADLRDRMIIVEPLSLEGQHRDEQDVWAETEAAVPPTLGALFTACSAALRHWGGVAGPFFRLADFSRFIMAAELGGAMPWEIGRFAAAYGQNRTAALGTLVAGIAWAEAFVESMFNAHRDAPQEPTLAHSAARILGDLTRGLDPTERQFYPTDPTRLAGELRRIAPALLTVYGLRVEFQRTCGRRRITTSWEEGALARYVSRDPTA
jgi:energy-coupling factor transporter ATP-binding protein EcfA2